MRFRCMPLLTRKKTYKPRPIIAKILCNHQREVVWENRRLFANNAFDPPFFVNERLSEHDRDIFIYCKKE